MSILVLVLIFVTALSIRLSFGYSDPYSSTEAYYNLRQTEHIMDKGIPMFYDQLSYSGRSTVFPSFFVYILAFFGYMMPLTLVGKIIPNIFACTIIFFVYLIVQKISKNEIAALFSAFLSSFIPIYVIQTFNNISVYSIVIPLIFFQIYCFLNIKNKIFSYLFIISLIFLSIIHISGVFLVIGLIFYWIIMKTENIKLKSTEFELILFSIFFIIWIQFIFNKKLLLYHGFRVIWQNIPLELLSNFFSKITILDSIYYIGIIPFLAGIYIIYKHLFQEKNAQIYLLIGFAISTSILLWMRLMEINIGLTFLGIIFCILFGHFIKLVIDYIEKTKISKFYSIILILIFISTIFLSAIPSVYSMIFQSDHAVKSTDIKALEWLKNNSPYNTTVIGYLEDGHLITQIAKRKNVIDDNFLLINNPGEILEDVNRFYHTDSYTIAVDILDKYNVDYVFISNNVLFDEKANILKIKEQGCFELIYNDISKIYDARGCKLKDIKPILKD